MPNVEAIREWVADLRSGKYAQTTNVLRHEDAYCCLGVACETYRRVTGHGQWKDEDGELYFSANEDLSGAEDQTLPEGVQRWLGVEDNDPRPVMDGDPTHATELNDNQRLTFAEIAGAVERTYLSPEAP